MTDFWVVEAALDGFAGRIGMRGTAGMVAVRACFVAEVAGCAGGSIAEGVVTCVRSTSDGGCEVEGVSTSASEGTATVDASDSVGSSVGVRSPSAASSTSSTGSSSKACSRDGRARPSSPAATGARRLLLPLAARGGNGPGTDSHGSGGWNGLYVVDGTGVGKVT